MDAWIQSYSGLCVNIESPTTHDISIFDIAHSLSLQCRFNGHTETFYSVAQHSCFVQRHLRDTGRSVHTQLAGLLHDAHEAYLSDISSPMKAIQAVADTITTLEQQFDAAIYEAFDLDTTKVDWVAVKNADLVALVTEANQLLVGGPIDSWTSKFGVEPYNEILQTLSPAAAEHEFNKTFHDLVTACSSTKHGMN